MVGKKCPLLEFQRWLAGNAEWRLYPLSCLHSARWGQVSASLCLAPQLLFITANDFLAAHTVLGKYDIIFMLYWETNKRPLVPSLSVLNGTCLVPVLTSFHSAFIPLTPSSLWSDISEDLELKETEGSIKTYIISG